MEQILLLIWPKSGEGVNCPSDPYVPQAPTPIDAYFVCQDHHINHQSYLPFIFHIFPSTILHELLINDYDTGVCFILFPPTVDKSPILTFNSLLNFEFLFMLRRSKMNI